MNCAKGKNDRDTLFWLKECHCHTQTLRLQSLTPAAHMDFDKLHGSSQPQTTEEHVCIPGKENQIKLAGLNLQNTCPSPTTCLAGLLNCFPVVHIKQY